MILNVSQYLILLLAGTSVIDDPGRPVSPLMISVDEGKHPFLKQSIELSHAG